MVCTATQPWKLCRGLLQIVSHGFKSHARNQQDVLSAGGDVFFCEPLDPPDDYAYSDWDYENINLDRYFRTGYWELLAPVLTSLRLKRLFTKEIPQGRLDWLLLLRNLQVLEVGGTCPTQTFFAQSGGVAAGMQCTQNRAFSRLCVCRLVNTGAHHLPRTTQLPSSEKIDSSSIHPWRTLQPGVPLTRGFQLQGSHRECAAIWPGRMQSPARAEMFHPWVHRYRQHGASMDIFRCRECAQLVGGTQAIWAQPVSPAAMLVQMRTIPIIARLPHQARRIAQPSIIVEGGGSAQQSVSGCANAAGKIDRAHFAEVVLLKRHCDWTIPDHV
jgi:hypothetical protein